MVQSEVCSSKFDYDRNQVSCLNRVSPQVQAEESGQFRYSILVDGAEIHSVINTTPKVWSGIQAQTGRTETGTNLVVTPGSFRNLQLTSG